MGFMCCDFWYKFLAIRKHFACENKEKVGTDDFEFEDGKC